MSELHHGTVQIYAFDRSFEGAIAACGAPLVGIIAEKLFGFKVCPKYGAYEHGYALLAETFSFSQ